MRRPRDPNEFRKLWRLPLEFGELLGKLRYKPIDRSLNKDINTWFDFRAWGALVVKEGMIAFHDVDDHAGTNLACRRILRQKNYQVWGYCPNLVALKRSSGSPTCQKPFDQTDR